MAVGMTLLETEKFIAQIKKHPAIYDMDCAQYNDRVCRTNAWFAVCKSMVDDWNQLGEEDRVATERIFRKRWRNIRDYFMKEIKMQKKYKSTARGRKRKKYAFYNQLLFLLPNVKQRGPHNKSAGGNNYKNEVVLTDDIEMITTPGIEEYNLTEVALAEDDPENTYGHQNVVCDASINTFENEIPVDVLSTTRPNERTFTNDDGDYDRMFLLSLLPSLRQVPEHIKLHVRIQIQQILASAFNPSSHVS